MRNLLKLRATAPGSFRFREPVLQISKVRARKPGTLSKMPIGVRAAKRGLPPIPAFGIGWLYWLYPVCPAGPATRPQPFPGVASEIIQSKIMDIAGNTNATRAPGSGSALAGFFVSGFLFALLGAILPAWVYRHDLPGFISIGNYFLALAIGIVAAARFARPIMLRRSVSFLLVFACGLSFIAILFLAWVSPPLSDIGRASGFGVLGAGIGLLNLALFHARS